MGVWGKSQNGKKNSFWNRNTYPHCRIHSSTLEVYSRQITVKHGSISLNITLDRKKYTNAIQKRCWKRLHSGICIRGEVILSLKQNFITGQETLRGRYDRTQRTGRWGSRTSRSDKKKKVGWEWKGKQGMSIPTEWWNQRPCTPPPALTHTRGGNPPSSGLSQEFGGSASDYSCCHHL